MRESTGCCRTPGSSALGSGLGQAPCSAFLGGLGPEVTNVRLE